MRIKNKKTAHDMHGNTLKVYDCVEFHIGTQGPYTGVVIDVITASTVAVRDASGTHTVMTGECAKIFPHACWFCTHPNLKTVCKCNGLAVGTAGGMESWNASVRCPKCHARGPTVNFKAPIRPQIDIDTEVGAYLAKVKAIDAWNALDGYEP